MAALMMVSNNSDGAGNSMANMNMPGMNMTGAKMPAMSMSETNINLSPNLSIPYGFPAPDHYRIFLQFKRNHAIETAHFDATVN